MEVKKIYGGGRNLLESGKLTFPGSRENRILPLLAGFPEFNPEDLFPARFKRRYSSKYIISHEVFEGLLPELEKNFNLVGSPREKFRTMIFRYFDTVDFRFYLDHVNGKNSRMKIRLRKGVEDEPDELEIWSRLNKGSMIKDRIPVNVPWPELHGNIIPAHYFEGGTVPELHASLDIVFDRFSFLRNDSGERIIVDTGISFFKPDSSIAECSFKNLIFAEVRRKRKQESIFESALKKENIRNTGFSKYCLGIATIEPGLKSNACKPAFRIIENLLNQAYV